MYMGPEDREVLERSVFMEVLARLWQARIDKGELPPE
jgi:hypothetical protein